MSLDTGISINPLKIRNVNELNDILDSISAYEKKFGCKAGVVKKQTPILGGSYNIMSEERASDGIKNQTCKPDIYLKFYPKSYFEEKLKEYSV